MALEFALASLSPAAVSRLSKSPPENNYFLSLLSAMHKTQSCLDDSYALKLHEMNQYINQLNARVLEERICIRAEERAILLVETAHRKTADAERKRAKRAEQKAESPKIKRPKRCTKKRKQCVAPSIPTPQCDNTQADEHVDSFDDLLGCIPLTSAELDDTAWLSFFDD